MRSDRGGSSHWVYNESLVEIGLKSIDFKTTFPLGPNREADISHWSSGCCDTAPFPNGTSSVIRVLCCHWTISAPSTGQRHLELLSLTSVYCLAPCQLQIWDYHKHSGEKWDLKEPWGKIRQNGFSDFFHLVNPVSVSARTPQLTHVTSGQTRGEKARALQHSPYTDFAATFWFFSTDTYIQRRTRILRSTTMWDMTKIWQ